MYKILIFIALMLLLNIVHAQNVGINETGALPHPSAMIDITSTDKGILIPRLADHTTIAAPAQGLLVYNNTGNMFWYWDGTQWLPLLGANAGWQILGNAGIDPLINFVGTTDPAALMFRVNNTQAGRIDWNAVVSGSTVGTKGSTALGFNALSALTSGYYNTAYGFNAGNSISTGFGNTVMGYGAATSLQANHSNVIVGEVAGASLSAGDLNVFIGKQAANSMVTGSRNVVFGGQTAREFPGGDDNIIGGYRAGFEMVSGNNNIILGSEAGYRIETNENILIGTRAAFFATNSIQNTIIGYRAGHNMSTGGRNTLIGWEAGFSLSTGNRNIFIGEEAGRQVTTGFRNVYIGEMAGRNKSSGQNNVAVGWGAMAEVQGATGPRENVAVGRRAGAYVTGLANVFLGNNSGLYSTGAVSNTFVGASTGMGGGLAISARPGSHNTFLGFQAGTTCLADCTENTFLGSRAGEVINTGRNNVFIGFAAGFSLPGGTSNRLIIANEQTNNDILIYGEFDTDRVGINTILPEHTLSVDGTASKPGGGEWLVFSDHRLKTDISVFEDGLNVVMNLEPVKFKYNRLSGYKEIEKEYIGFIAQDVEQVAPYMVTLLDDSNGPSALADKRVLDTSALNQILVNAVQEQQVHIQSLEDRVSQLENLLLKVLDEKEVVAEK